MKTKYVFVVFLFQILIWKSKLIYVDGVLLLLTYVIIPSIVIMLIIYFFKRERSSFLLIFVVLNLMLYFSMLYFMKIAEANIVEQIKHTNEYIQGECCEKRICPRYLANWKVNISPEWTKPDPNYNRYILELQYGGEFEGFLQVFLNKNGQDYEFFYHYFDHVGTYYGGVNKCRDSEELSKVL